MLPTLLATPVIAPALAGMDTAVVLAVAAGSPSSSGSPLLARGASWAWFKGLPGAVAAGLASATLNVVGGVGGPPVGMFAANARLGPVQARATLQFFFLIQNIVTALVIGVAGPQWWMVAAPRDSWAWELWPASPRTWPASLCSWWPRSVVRAWSSRTCEPARQAGVMTKTLMSLPARLAVRVKCRPDLVHECPDLLALGVVGDQSRGHLARLVVDLEHALRIGLEIERPGRVVLLPEVGPDEHVFVRRAGAVPAVSRCASGRLGPVVVSRHCGSRSCPAGRTFRRSSSRPSRPAGAIRAAVQGEPLLMPQIAHDVSVCHMPKLLW